MNVEALLASPHWRWMPGMRDVNDGARVVQAANASGVVLWHCIAREVWGEHPEDACTPWTPDLTDPATLGCLLALVREAWDNPSMFMMPTRTWPDGVWHWAVTRLVGTTRPVPGLYATEAEALVAALLAAPAHEGEARA